MTHVHAAAARNISSAADARKYRTLKNSIRPDSALMDIGTPKVVKYPSLDCALEGQMRNLKKQQQFGQHTDGFSGAEATENSSRGMCAGSNCCGTQNKGVTRLVELDQFKYTLNTYREPFVELRDSL